MAAGILIAWKQVLRRRELDWSEQQKLTETFHFRDYYGGFILGISWKLLKPPEMLATAAQMFSAARHRRENSVSATRIFPREARRGPRG